MKTQLSHIPVEARLFHNGTLIGTCGTKYLGLLGIVLDASSGALPVGTTLEIELRLVRKGLPPACRLHAVVNQHSRLGVGLTFRHPGRHECTELQKIIYESWRFAAATRHTGDGRHPTATAWQVVDETLPKAG